MKYSELNEYITINNLLSDIEHKSGIYSITIDDQIVYVGQAIDVYQRCSQHIYKTQNAMLVQEKKYLLLLSALLGGHKVDYSVIEYCDDEELREKEDYWILYYRPCLNINIPRESKQDISNLRIIDVLNIVEAAKDEKEEEAI